MPAAVPFIIATQPRCGSSWLATLLDAHEQVTCHGELLADPATFPEGGFQELLERHVFGTSEQAVGFKLFYEQQVPGLVEFLIRQQTRVVFLRRDNLLRQYISLQLAFATNRWSVLRPETPTTRLAISVEAMLSWFDLVLSERTEQNIDFSQLPSVTISYERLVQNQERELGQIWDLLEVPSVRVTSPLFRQETRSIQQIVENFEEVQFALRGTDRESFLTSEPFATV